MDAPPITPAPSSERRTEYRKPLRTRVNLAFSDRRPADGRAFDVAAGGMGVVLDVNLPIGTMCSVSFSLLFKDGHSVAGKTNAKVAYCVLSGKEHGFKIGLQFTNISEQLATSVVRYLES